MFVIAYFGTRLHDRLHRGVGTDTQGHIEARWRLGQATNLATLCLKVRSFESKCTVLKSALATLLGLFSAPQ